MKRKTCEIWKKKKRNSLQEKRNIIYIKSSHPLAIQNLFVSLFSASHDILKAQVFRNNAILWNIYVL